MTSLAKVLCYQMSDEWQKRRYHILRERGYQCEKCGRKRLVEVSHKNADLMGDEPDSDLTVLCEWCHQELVKERRKNESTDSSR